MTHSQLLETESAPDRVAELQSWIAGAVERLEAPNSEDGFAVEILDQCLVRLDVLGSAAGLDGYGDLEALSSILSEHYWSLRDDNRGLTAEDLLVLFDWTTAAGMYLESPNEPEVIDALLSPLPEEQQALVREVLSAEVSSGSDATPLGGDELPCRDPQGTTPTFVQSAAEPNAGDSSASAPNVLVFPVDENDCISTSSEEPAQDAREEYGADCFDGDTLASVELLAPDMEDDGAEADSVLAVLADELGEISPELSSLAEVIAGTDEAAAELAASSYLELVGRLSAVSEGLGLDGLSHITEFVVVNLGLTVQSGRESRAATRSLFAQWPRVVQQHLREPHADNLCHAVIDFLEEDAWPQPLAYKEVRTLLQELTKDLVITGDGEEEARSEVATPEDVSLELEQNVSQAVVDAFMAEAPGNTEQLTQLVGEVIAGNNVVENTRRLQRLAHTLKGSANLIALKGVANLAHHLEDIFEYLVKKESAPPNALGFCLQEAADTIEAMVEAVQGLAPPPADAQRVLQDVLAWANRVDGGLRDADPIAPTATSKPLPEEPTQKASSVGESQDQLRVPRSTVDNIFKLVGETSIALGQIQERMKRLRGESATVRSQDRLMQQRRFDLENLVSVRGMAVRQRRVGTSKQDFDPLEMDEYDEFYGATHAFIEAVADEREASWQVANELLELETLFLQQQRLNRDLQEIAVTLRMVPVKSIAGRLQRSVRQACRATGKQAELKFLGEDLQLDGDVLGKLVDPLMHVLRNAVDHGIEVREEREEKGKPAAGSLVLEFKQEGNNIRIQCSDDGRGLDYPRIREKAVARGLLGATEEVTDITLARLLLKPGFTTRDQATHVSGRGVGMDVVNTAVIGLKGSIDISDQDPSGTEVSLRLPITMLTSHSLLVRAGDSHFAVPTAALEQILSPDAGRFETLGSDVIYRLADDVYPARSLPGLLSIRTEQDLLADNHAPVLLVRVDNEIHAVAVNQVIASYDLVVKNLGWYVGDVRGISGVSILGDGDVVPVLDMADLLRNKETRTASETWAEDTAEAPEQICLPRILIVDDSLSVRKSLSQLMQDAGLKPLVARDGVEALEVMRQDKPDLVVTDLEMPRMSGLELSSHIRASEETRDLPVVMITSRTMQKHRSEAERSGVNLYVTKPFSEDVLVNDITRMLTSMGAI